MCGIAGSVSRNRDRVRSGLDAAIHQLQHRGPEAKAVWINPAQTVSLGHTRLCIIDPSEAAAQPFHYKERYTLLYNGELYNYLELKKMLSGEGFPFTTQSDTEVVIAAYAAWGPACLSRFDGMFAFAIWDEQEQVLFCARDTFGEKPFFFYKDEESFCFASELKALWSLGIPKEVNRPLLYNFISIGYAGNPADPMETFYQGIHKLPAASFLRYELQTGQLVLEKYRLSDAAVNESVTEDQVIEQFRSLLTQSVQRRLRSDVAIGTSLSGGLDSSTIAALCARQHGNQYTHKAFTAIFPGFEKNEQGFAEAIVQRYGLKHHLVEIEVQEIPMLMDQVMYFQEEPFSSGSVLAQFRVYEAAKKAGVTVLLDGQGADETLAGYTQYYRWYWRELFRKKQLRSSGERTAAQQQGFTPSFGWMQKTAALFPDFAMSLQQSRKAKQAYQNPDLNRDFAFENKRNLYYSLPVIPDLNGVLYHHTFVQGLEELLRVADRNSMAHAVEVRLPFLSPELVDFLFALPARYKIREGWTKWLLRKAMEKELPETIVWRKDKVGFEPPQHVWMQDKIVQEAILEGKRKLVEQGILDASALTKKVQPHTAYAAESKEWRYWSAAYLFR